MSKVRCTSIKGLGVPANGPEINLNKFSHGQPLDLDGSAITANTLTLSNVNFTTSTSATMNATNVVAKDRGQMNFNGSELLVPTSATRPTNPVLGSFRVNTNPVQIEMYVDDPVTGIGWKKLG